MSNGCSRILSGYTIADMATTKSQARYTAKYLLKMLPEEKLAFEEQADKEGLPFGAWLRQLARKRCGMNSAGDEDES